MVGDCVNSKLPIHFLQHDLQPYQNTAIHVAAEFKLVAPSGKRYKSPLEALQIYKNRGQQLRLDLLNVNKNEEDKVDEEDSSSLPDSPTNQMHHY